MHAKILNKNKIQDGGGRHLRFFLHKQHEHYALAWTFIGGLSG